MIPGATGTSIVQLSPIARAPLRVKEIFAGVLPTAAVSVTVPLHAENEPLVTFSPDGRLSSNVTPFSALVLPAGFVTVNVIVEVEPT